MPGESRFFKSPQYENALDISQQVDVVVKKFLEKDPAQIEATELYEAISEIDSFRDQAEKSGEENLPKYLDSKIAELRKHKNSTLKTQLEDMGSLQHISKPDSRGKKKIGTHGRTI